jgi:hypothetical protein
MNRRKRCKEGDYVKVSFDKNWCLAHPTKNTRWLFGILVSEYGRFVSVQLISDDPKSTLGTHGNSLFISSKEEWTTAKEKYVLEAFEDDGAIFDKNHNLISYLSHYCYIDNDQDGNQTYSWKWRKESR